VKWEVDLHSNFVSEYCKLQAAGDKSGGSEKRFYRQLIEKADERFDAHVAKIKKQKEKERK
jgi:hypothetical protein